MAKKTIIKVDFGKNPNPKGLVITATHHFKKNLHGAVVHSQYPFLMIDGASAKSVEKLCESYARGKDIHYKIIEEDEQIPKDVRQVIESAPIHLKQELYTKIAELQATYNLNLATSQAALEKDYEGIFAGFERENAGLKKEIQELRQKFREKKSTSGLCLELIEHCPERFEGLERLVQGIESFKKSGHKNAVNIKRIQELAQLSKLQYISKIFSEQHPSVPEEELKILLASTDTDTEHQKAKTLLDFAVQYQNLDGKTTTIHRFDLNNPEDKIMAEQLYNSILANRQKYEETIKSHEAIAALKRKYEKLIQDTEKDYEGIQQDALRINEIQAQNIEIPVIVNYVPHKKLSFLVPLTKADKGLYEEIRRCIDSSYPNFLKRAEEDETECFAADIPKNNVNEDAHSAIIHNILDNQRGYMFYELGGRIQFYHAFQPYDIDNLKMPKKGRTKLEDARRLIVHELGTGAKSSGTLRNYTNKEGVSHDSFYKALTQLKEEGLIKKEEGIRGRYMKA